MTRTTLLPTILAALIAFCLQASPAQALLPHTYVSAAIGDDANNCDRPTPCRTFQTAHNQTSPDGEITVLDPGGYGGLVITKSISIVNDGGGEASILVSSGGTGITVIAPAAAYVNLRGLTIQGIGFGGGWGIVFITGFSLTIENCVVRNHTHDGIFFEPQGNSNLSVSNTLVADNGRYGINVFPTGSGATVKAVFNRVEAYNNSSIGIYVVGTSSTGTINTIVADSVANNNAYGFAADSSSGHATTSLMVVRSVSANNGVGLYASGAPAILRFGLSTVMGNRFFSRQVANGGAVQSYGDNNINGNGDGDPSPPTITHK